MFFYCYFIMMPTQYFFNTLKFISNKVINIIAEVKMDPSQDSHK